MYLKTVPNELAEELRKTQNHYKPGKVQRMLMQFHESEHDVIEVAIEPDDYKSGTRGAQGSYHNAIKRTGYAMTAIIRDGHLYLIKTGEAVPKERT